ncbi:MAG: hypothetical protein QY318_00060 [Candidatus Dojkabacteria bacterium]|nr:MAG: hypothetical protein QY318_00060 [Candidatus Dojkabacteria bacterium]
MKYLYFILAPVTFLSLLLLALIYPYDANAEIFQVDQGFGTSGETLLPLEGIGQQFFSIDMAANGKYLVAGSILGEDELSGATLWLLNSNGTVDTAFNTTGYRIYNPIPGESDHFYDVVEDDDGRYVALGGYSEGLEAIGIISRINPNSTLDTTFNDDGYAYWTGTGGGDADFPKVLIIDSSGKYVVIGSTWDEDMINVGAIWRFNTDGLLDNTFSVDGAALVPEIEPDYSSVLLSVVEDSSGKYYALGNDQNNTDLFVISFDNDGSINTDFGTAGYSIVDVGMASYDESVEMILDGDNLVITGFADTGPDGDNDIFVLRMNLEGEMDTSFGTGGIMQYDMETSPTDESSDRPDNIAVDSQGRYLVSASTTSEELSESLYYVMRITAAGELDTTFADEGFFYVDSAYILDLHVDQLDRQTYLQADISSVMRAELLYNVTNLAAGLAVEYNEVSVEEGSGNGAVGNVVLRLSDASGVIAEVVTSMTQDRDWSTVTAGMSLTEFKSFVHNLLDAEGTAASFTLYIPKRADDNRVGICPGATSLAEVTLECPGFVEYAQGDPGVSVVTIDSVEYWVISGLTGTGGISYSEEDLATSGINLVAIIALSILSITAVTILILRKYKTKSSSISDIN